ncbi:MAG: HipA domain-containing protein [Pseudomonadota bacterium]
MLTLDVLLDAQLAGRLTYFQEQNTFEFHYAPDWLSKQTSYSLSPKLSIEHSQTLPTPDQSAQIRFFFENLLPEGQALDDAAAASKVSKSNLVGLISALGRETAGAVSLRFVGKGDPGDWQDPYAGQPAEQEKLRHLTREELAQRINARPLEPFTVWDGKVRLSIAGFQDKIAVLKDEGEWYFIDAGARASTVILKPEPLTRRLAGLTTNEFFCMRLAKAVGLPVADVRLVHLPNPVLEIDRFDRVLEQGRIRRRHIIDGCQALGIAPGMKYERPYGDAKDVRDIRDGASLPRLFTFINDSTAPAAQRLHLLRWTIFQVLIGNTDAHAKNVSFYNDENGIRLTPTYDLVSTLSFDGDALADTLAMAIGDAFREPDITPYEWAHFAHRCGVRRPLLVQQLRDMSAKVTQHLGKIAAKVIEEGADHAVVSRICKTVEMISERHAAMAGRVAEVEKGLFE